MTKLITVISIVKILEMYQKYNCTVDLKKTLGSLLSLSQKNSHKGLNLQLLEILFTLNTFHQKKYKLAFLLSRNNADKATNLTMFFFKSEDNSITLKFHEIFLEHAMWFCLELTLQC